VARGTRKFYSKTAPAKSELAVLREEFNKLAAEVTDIQTKMTTLLAKLDDDLGVALAVEQDEFATVTDTDYEATCAPAAATAKTVT